MRIFIWIYIILGVITYCLSKLGIWLSGGDVFETNTPMDTFIEVIGGILTIPLWPLIAVDAAIGLYDWYKNGCPEDDPGIGEKKEDCEDPDYWLTKMKDISDEMLKK